MPTEIKTRAGIIIHSSASASALAAAALATIPVVGPTALEFPVLTSITVGMVVMLSRLFGQDPDREKLASLVAVILGTASGSFIALAVFSLIPFAGAGINAAVTFGITETIGWGFYKVLEEGKDLDELRSNKADAKHIYDTGRIERPKEESEWILHLPDDVNKKYQSLLESLKNSSSEAEAANIMDQIEETVKPYKPKD